MLYSLTTKEQTDAWADIYSEMKNRWKKSLIVTVEHIEYLFENKYVKGVINILKENLEDLKIRLRILLPISILHNNVYLNLNTQPSVMALLDDLIHFQ